MKSYLQSVSPVMDEYDSNRGSSQVSRREGEKVARQSHSSQYSRRYADEEEQRTEEINVPRKNSMKQLQINRNSISYRLMAKANLTINKLTQK